VCKRGSQAFLFVNFGNQIRCTYVKKVTCGKRDEHGHIQFKGQHVGHQSTSPPTRNTIPESKLNTTARFFDADGNAGNNNPSQ